MEIKLTKEEKQDLEQQHRSEHDKRIADRIKAVLLFSEGWTQIHIARALRITPETVSTHLKEYIELKKLNHNSGGSESHLNSEQIHELIAHLELDTYLKVEDICAYVKEKYGITYTVSGMTKWLHAHKFSFKKPKGTQTKADPIKQAEFEKVYKELLQSKDPKDPVIFGDGVHPTMATKITYGWIRTGKDKPIATTASRTRVNLFGGINLETKEAAEELKIVLHYLPPYSPNLNPTERLWKVISEHVRNNHVFKKVQEFRQGIDGFFNNTWPKIASTMKGRINDNFQYLKS